MKMENAAVYKHLSKLIQMVKWLEPWYAGPIGSAEYVNIFKIIVDPISCWCQHKFKNTPKGSFVNNSVWQKSDDLDLATDIWVQVFKNRAVKIF